MTGRHRRWGRLVQYVAPFLLVVAVAFGSVRYAVRYYQHDQCVQSRDRTEQLRNVVIKATEPPTSSGTPLDLTKAEGFDSLDPTMQTWARSVQKMIEARPSSATTLRDTLLAVIPPIDC